MLPKNAPVRLASAQLEEPEYRKLYEAYSPKGRKSAADPRVMFGETDHESVFIDETKLESRAGRYTFCWRESVTDRTFLYLAPVLAGAVVIVRKLLWFFHKSSFSI